MRRLRAGVEGIRGGRCRALPALWEESERLLSELEGDILSVIHGDRLRAWGAEKVREARELFGKKRS
jgi:hypothetical protein